ncbi:hypothetical protein Poli38472_011238 [Pythium oligandrum]|uniref:Elicitin n=1 Tax=Pythium oligandrum TaxID=41045 RepID=A0A8K1FRI6_PYTOL|nr:hypothetical protein Poli38472_011237 [Pythium oligandrum]TMW67618.1 hypothetical protein Poli38472_011238 [Pythium oligandrum]|eukprot:TMW67617.1 hypothetical protein Poli38472_011237 [Pythium oligandrum]
MKFAAVLIAATFAVASAADATVPTCDTAALGKILQGENSKACSKSTGFSAVAAKPVSADNAAKVCPEKSCQALLKEISDSVKTECLALGITPLISGILKPSEEACAKLANGAAGGAAAAGSTTGSGAVGDVTVPETTTGAPVSGSTTGSADAATSGSGAESPAAGSVPSPAPSSAVKIAAATSAAAVAVVATLF